MPNTSLRRPLSFRRRKPSMSSGELRTRPRRKRCDSTFRARLTREDFSALDRHEGVSEAKRFSLAGAALQRRYSMRAWSAGSSTGEGKAAER